MMRAPLYQLLVAYIVSIIGDWSFKIAIPVIVYNLTGSALLMSAAFASSFAPYIIMMPLGGVIADILPRKKVLYWSDFIAGLISAAICAYLALGGDRIFFILPGLFALGLVSAVYHPAFQGIIPSITSRENLPRANSLFTTSDNILNLIGPIASAVMITAFRPEWVIWFNTISFLLSGVLIRRLKAPQEAQFVSKTISFDSIANDLADGFHMVWSQPVIKWGTLLFIFQNFATNLIVGNLMFLLTKTLNLSVADAGVVIGLAACGAVGGALLAPKLMLMFPPGPLMLTCLFTVAAGTSLMLLGPVAGAPVIALGRGVIMAAEAIIVVTMFTLRQRVIPQNFLSRTVAITRTISYVPIPVAAIAGGYILTISEGDMRPLIFVSTAVLLLCGCGGLLTPFSRGDRFETNPVA